MATTEPSSDSDASKLILAAIAGDRSALEQLLPLVYGQLRREAERVMRSERTGHTLSATALVHEAYLKLAGPREIPWAGRAHFYAAATQAMGRILVDHAKSKLAQKRGGDWRKVRAEDGSLQLERLPDAASTDPAEFLALDEALARLEERDARAALIVRLRYFAGLEISQVAEMIGVNERTVKHDWTFARSWLQRELTRSA